MRKILFGGIAAVLATGVIMAPGTANAWWRGGFGGGVVFFAPPVYVAPPPVVVYAPAPVYAAPPPGQTCYAGAYICPLDHATPVGAGCSCPTNGGRSYGRAR